MRVIFFFPVFILLASAQCNGSKGSLTSTRTEAATAKDRSQASRCVVPTPSTPPPMAQKAKRCPPDPIFGGLSLPTAKVVFPQAKGSAELVVEVAKTAEETSRGLMYRTHLSKNRGMLFDFRPQERVHSFWMRNTCIPLDMLFIDKDGFITGIIESAPPLSDRSQSIPCRVSYVLEVNAGWSRAHGVKAGQTAQLPR